MIPFSFIFVEIVALILFSFAAWEARRKGLGRLAEFFMIFFYGIILEELDMRIFKSYHYGPYFSLALWQVPICIAFLWAVIIGGSMAISDAWGLPEFVKPFSDALLAVWIDLAVDAIAIRMGYWTWVIPMNEGWFGVPAGNLYAWMWVAFSYSLFARIIRRLTEKNKLWIFAYFILPVFSYAALFLQMNFVGMLGKLLGLKTPAERLILFAAQFFIFLGAVRASWSKRRPDPEPLAPIWKWSRLSIHFYFLGAFLLFGIYKEIPFLGAIAFLILAGEFFFMKPFAIRRGEVSSP